MQNHEFEHTAIPMHKRQSLLSSIMVWVGFPLVITGAFLGGQLALSLGFINAIWATLIGNLVLFIYVGTLSVIGSQTGLSFSLISKNVFGPHFSKIVSGLLSILVVGWFAVQTGMAGQGLHDILGWSVLWSSLILGAVFVFITLAGVRSLRIIGMVSVPLFFAVALYALYIIFLNQDFESIRSYSGNPTAASMGIGLAITLVISLFIDSGTLTADFSRWCKNPTHALIATCSAFPLANSISMILGIVAVSSGLSKDGNFSNIIVEHSPNLILLAALFFIVNCASVTTHCLYNAATGFSGMSNKSFKIMTLILGCIGCVIASLGVWNYLIQWLNALGMVVPGIGAVIIASYLDKSRTFHPTTAICSWIISVLFALALDQYFQSVSVAICAMLTAFFSYFMISRHSQLKAALKH